jgi:hypothetical protein
MTFALYVVSSSRVPEQHLEDEDAFIFTPGCSSGSSRCRC